MSWFNKLDKWMGRGSYYWLRGRLDPARTYYQWEYADLLERVVTPQTRWLDGGCGHQILEVRLQEREERLVARAELVVGCDPFALSLKKHRTIVNRVMCPLDDLPFLDGSFNLVTLNMVVEHLADPAKVFRQITRVLEPGGTLVLVTPNRASYYVRLADVVRAAMPSAMLRKLVERLDSRQLGTERRRYYRANTPEQIGRQMVGTGMTAECMRLMRGRPFFFFFLPFSVMEMVLVRVLESAGVTEFISDVMMTVYRREELDVPSYELLTGHAVGVATDWRGL